MNMLIKMKKIQISEQLLSTKYQYKSFVFYTRIMKCRHNYYSHLSDPKTEVKEFHFILDLLVRQWSSQALNSLALKVPGFQ